MYVYVVNNHDESWEDSTIGVYSSLHLATKEVFRAIKEDYLDEEIPVTVKEIESYPWEQIFVCEKKRSWDDDYKEIFEFCIEKIELDK